jgi:CheY-like chemotaxis protein
MEIRALIVDDNKAFLGAATTLLEQEGLTVAGVASTGPDAIRQAESLRPDVILVDVFLGRESGFELCRHLAEEAPGDRATLILISTQAAADLEDLIAGCPAAAFVPKAELSADAIRRIVEGRRR